MPVVRGVVLELGCLRITLVRATDMLSSSYRCVDEETVKDDRFGHSADRPNEVWALAVERARSGRSLGIRRVGGCAVEAAAEQLGVSRGHVYFLVRLWREMARGRCLICPWPI